MQYRFPKSERLYGLKTIEKLYREGKAFIAYPFRVVYLIVEEDKENVPVRVMVSAPKKRFKRAVDRNRIKRLMREAYRLNKSGLYDFALGENLKLHVSLQYIANEILPWRDMELRMQKALGKFMKILTVNSDEENQ